MERRTQSYTPEQQADARNRLAYLPVFTKSHADDIRINTSESGSACIDTFFTHLEQRRQDMMVVAANILSSNRDREKPLIERVLNNQLVISLNGYNGTATLANTNPNQESLAYGTDFRIYCLPYSEADSKLAEVYETNSGLLVVDRRNIMITKSANNMQAVVFFSALDRVHNKETPPTSVVEMYIKSVKSQPSIDLEISIFRENDTRSITYQYKYANNEGTEGGNIQASFNVDCQNLTRRTQSMHLFSDHNGTTQTDGTTEGLISVFRLTPLIMPAPETLLSLFNLDISPGRNWPFAF